MDIKNLLNEINESDQHEENINHYSSPLSSSSTCCSGASSAYSSENISVTAITGKKTRNQQQTRTPWTPTEDYFLEKGYMQGLSWAMISSKYLPHRSRGCCWGRFKTVRAKISQKKSWCINEDQSLLISIKRSNRLFKQAWKSVSLDLNSRDWKECEVRSSHIGFPYRNQITIP